MASSWESLAATSTSAPRPVTSATPYSLSHTTADIPYCSASVHASNSSANAVRPPPSYHHASMGDPNQHSYVPQSPSPHVVPMQHSLHQQYHHPQSMPENLHPQSPHTHGHPIHQPHLQQYSHTSVVPQPHHSSIKAQLSPQVFFF